MSVFRYEKTDPATIGPLRAMQINDLHGPAQDSTEENILVYNADFMLILCGTEMAGYACIGTHEGYKGVLLEFYLVGKFRYLAGRAVKELAERCACKQWLVNTQDFFAFPVMLESGFPYKIDAYKFSAGKGVQPDCVLPANIALELAKADQIDELYALIMQSGFYTGGGIETLEPIVQAKELYSLKADEKLVGAGFVSALARTPKYADIAMIIDENHRNKGLGTLLVKGLMAKSRAIGLLPTAVCDVANSASRNTLQKAGFTLDGCLLLAQVK